MARKIRSFKEYDTERAGRAASFLQTVQSQLELLVRMDPLQQEGRGKGFSFRSRISQRLAESLQDVSVADGIKALLKGPRGLLELALENYTAPFLVKAEHAASLVQFKSNVGDLISCGAAVAQAKGGRLNRADKEQFYARFLDELKTITETTVAPELRVLPELRHLQQHYHLPELQEDQQKFVRVIQALKKSEYLSKEKAQSITRLLFSTEQQILAAPASPATVEPCSKRVSEEIAIFPAKVSAPTATMDETMDESSDSNQDKVEYLTFIFRLPEKVAREYAPRVTLQQIDEIHRNLTSVMGNDYTPKLIEANPDLLTYHLEGLLTKYLTTLTVVQEKIRKNGSRGINLADKFGLEHNLDRYASLEQLLKLKRELCAVTGEYAIVAEPQAKELFNLENYKDRLLQKAGLDLDIVRALTHGKNSYFKGEAYMPAEYFRKNSHGKVSGQVLSERFSDTFDALVQMRAIIKKPKDASPLYRLNPHFNEITDRYLREYIRVTLFAQQILAQEGEITPKIDLDKE